MDKQGGLSEKVRAWFGIRIIQGVHSNSNASDNGSTNHDSGRFDHLACSNPAKGFKKGKKECYFFNKSHPLYPYKSSGTPSPWPASTITIQRRSFPLDEAMMKYKGAKDTLILKTLHAIETNQDGLQDLRHLQGHLETRKHARQETWGHKVKEYLFVYLSLLYSSSHLISSSTFLKNGFPFPMFKQAFSHHHHHLWLKLNNNHCLHKEPLPAQRTTACTSNPATALAVFALDFFWLSFSHFLST